ncbi:MAG: hypothetical protein H6Q64_2258 [Firmicutes bacterium]|nr:hypothetical protein [Bacillota bacterium]
MHKRKLLIPSILSLIYVLLCIMAFAFHIARHETDKFSAMFIAVLTLPWSFLESLFHDLVISTIFHFEFNYFMKNITISIWVILNAALIFFIVKKILNKQW